MKRLGVLAIALSLLGCSAHASISASAGGAKTAAAEPLKPRESDWERENREEAETATRAGNPVPQTDVADATNGAAASETAAVTPAKARRGKKAAHNRGKAKKQDPGNEIAAASSEERSDHNRGHGNDLDGVDEDNPGKSKKKK